MKRNVRVMRVPPNGGRFGLIKRRVLVSSIPPRLKILKASKIMRYFLRMRDCCDLTLNLYPAYRIPKEYPPLVI